MKSTIEEKYSISAGRKVYEYDKYRGVEYDYVVPETGEERTLYVPSGSSLVETLRESLKK